MSVSQNIANQIGLLGDEELLDELVRPHVGLTYEEQLIRETLYRIYSAILVAQQP